jgi:hypothetical protein
MRLCIQCGYPTSGADDMCAHHVASYADDWAVSNRIMCDFLHRGNVSRLDPARDGRPFVAEHLVDTPLIVHEHEPA